MRCFVGACLFLTASAVAAADRPNILWISAEDLSAVTIGCYGGQAKTPRIDALAKSGLQFQHAFAAAPVCAPSRSAIITGMMPTTLGSLPMRCEATPPPFVVGFPTFLREAGYYCTNNAKTDYNFDKSFKPGWNESSRKAHWRNRPDDSKPFFAVFNLEVTHESGLFADKLEGRLKSLPRAERADPATVRVPEFYPDTPVIREALAHRLDLAAVLDAQVGTILDELEADGLADSTIVVFWSDHGEGIPRGKRALTDFGLRVPLIVHVPDRFRVAVLPPGGIAAARETEKLVSLIDLGPTMLHIAGVAIPHWMEGQNFLGPHAVPRNFVVSVADRMDAAPGFGRTIRTANFRYVRNFLPWLDGDDLPDYASGVPITGELRKARAAGTLPKEADWFARTRRSLNEFYLLKEDPYEVVGVNLPRFGIERLQHGDLLEAWMAETRDTGILPEPILRRETRAAGSEYAIFHPGGDRDVAAAARYKTILAAAWKNKFVSPSWDDELVSPDSAVRYWAVQGTGWRASDAKGDTYRKAIAALEAGLADNDPVVAIIAAWWNLKLGAKDRQPALDVLAREMKSDDPDIRQQALVAIDQLGDLAKPLWNTAAAIEVGNKHKADEYSRRTVERIRKRLAESREPRL